MPEIGELSGANLPPPPPLIFRDPLQIDDLVQQLITHMPDFKNYLQRKDVASFGLDRMAVVEMLMELIIVATGHEVSPHGTMATLAW